MTDFSPVGDSVDGKSPILIAPSLLAANLLRIETELVSAEKGGADWHHIDVMDGHFVANLTFGLPLIRQLKQISSLPLDVHIMVANPDAVSSMYLKSGADLLTFHIEATHHAHRLVEMIKSVGKKPGVALNPATPVSQVFPILADLHHVLLMSVNPGFGGQKFIESTVAKCHELQAEIQRQHLEGQVLIQVDGGISSETIGAMAHAGATVFVAGSGIYGYHNRKEAISQLRREAQKHRVS
ncbi:MAG: ribulose-phosphate 3-epimerase [Proteobacteria bacterium]|nr:ribulose-phosphate 3-epimerase [Pseudomonadota bacterium]